MQRVLLNSRTISYISIYIHISNAFLIANIHNNASGTKHNIKWKLRMFRDNIASASVRHNFQQFLIVCRCSPPNKKRKTKSDPYTIPGISCTQYSQYLIKDRRIYTVPHWSYVILLFYSIDSCQLLSRFRIRTILSEVPI